jgi:ribonuclease HII
MLALCARVRAVANSAPRERFRIGADENGLGPRLGPMIVTAVLAEATPAGHAVASRKARGKLGERLADSKALVSHGNIALGEAWTRALVERGHGRPEAARAPQTVTDLVHAVSADAADVLRAPCPSGVEGQCWSTGFESLSADAALVKTLHADLDKLSAKGLRVIGVRSKIVCTKRLNDALGEGRSRFSVDLHAMEELILGFRQQAGDEVHAICGKVGGFGSYGSAFGPLNGRLHSVLEQGRASSRYYFPGVGELAFVMDADDSDLLVSMASLVGKYLREVLMARIVGYYQDAGPDVPDASGYHDPVTARLVEATALVRKQRGIPDDCFERRSLGGRAGAGG